jgi:hypothetical protein
MGTEALQKDYDQAWGGFPKAKPESGSA